MRRVLCKLRDFFCKLGYDRYKLDHFRFKLPDFYVSWVFHTPRIDTPRIGWDRPIR
ncbi:MAG: hypothetical protein PHQ75_12905 [Thermoguttaceae bacterium]|nr:hypothetical protein [Thermoguttaceae bacterium]